MPPSTVKPGLVPSRQSTSQPPAKSQNLDQVFLLLLTHMLLHFVKKALHRLDSVPIPQHKTRCLQIQPHIFVQVTNSF